MPQTSKFSLEVKKAYMFHASFSWSALKILTRWMIFLSVLRLSHPVTDPDVEGEALLEFLTALNDSNNQIRDWDSHFVSPCYSWSNVTCSNRHVISLSLANNGFSGTLSPSIAKLTYLVSLELQNNNLAGPLPDCIANLTHLEYLNLADNNFNGSIPATWGQLSSLKHLDLSSNGLTGNIPMPLFSIPLFNFSDTLLHCGSSLEQPCVSNSALPASTNKSKLAVVVSFASCGSFALLCLGAIFAYRYYHMHKHKSDVFFDVPVEKIFLA